MLFRLCGICRMAAARFSPIIILGNRCGKCRDILGEILPSLFPQEMKLSNAQKFSRQSFVPFVAREESAALKPNFHEVFVLQQLLLEIFITNDVAAACAAVTTKHLSPACWEESRCVHFHHRSHMHCTKDPHHQSITLRLRPRSVRLRL